MVGIREILDVITKLLVSRHHRKRLVMHICGDPPFRHLLNHKVSLLACPAKQADNVQVA